MSDSILHVQNLSKLYPKDTSPAVHNLSFDLKKGETVALLGRNGAGKSTALKMIMGFERPSWGEARVFGESSEELSAGTRGRIGYMAEGHPLIDWMRVAQLAEFTALTFPSWNENRFKELAALFKLDSRQRVKHLSRGQRARVSLALTMACQPELLLLDDPTLGLDVAIHRDFFRELIGEIADGGATILLSTHNLNDVSRVADRLLVLKQGVLQADTSPDAFREAFVEVFLKADGDIVGLPTQGLLSAKHQDGQWRIVFEKRSLANVQSWADREQLTLGAPGSLSLEDLFILFTEDSP